VVLAVDTLQPGPLVATVCAVSGFGVAFSQTFHALAHTKTCDIPPPFRALQDAGIIVSRRDHAAHHRSPYAGNYAIVSGVTNAALDRIGFWRKCEALVHRATGAAPRCWSDDPDAAWAESERAFLARGTA
jgi:ubiquitin-conjugating enzyme E2 variant